MATHELKCASIYISDIAKRKKNFELRFDDRVFEVGDKLWLRDYDKETGLYSGRDIFRKITFILRDFPGLEKGYCILSIE